MLFLLSNVNFLAYLYLNWKSIPVNSLPRGRTWPWPCGAGLAGGWGGLVWEAGRGLRQVEHWWLLFLKNPQSLRKKTVNNKLNTEKYILNTIMYHIDSTIINCTKLYKIACWIHVPGIFFSVCCMCCNIGLSMHYKYMYMFPFCLLKHLFHILRFSFMEENMIFMNFGFFNKYQWKQTMHIIITRLYLPESFTKIWPTNFPLASKLFSGCGRDKAGSSSPLIA